MGFIKKLAILMGKEVSDDILKDLEKELDEFKNLLFQNQAIENIPNLEIESYEIPVTVAASTVSLSFKTKIEHKKVVGLFLIHRENSGGAAANRTSLIGIQIDRKHIFNQGQFHYTLLEKADGLTIYETAWRIDVDIDTSDVQIDYVDGSTVTPPYKVYVNFICEK